MSKRDMAIKLAWLINDEGHAPYDAVQMLGLDPENDVYGEDIGDECLPLDDPDNDVIDLGWDERHHYQLKHRYSTTLGRKVWEVEHMELLTTDGKEAVTNGT
jgi:hypothetical protein